MMIFDKVRLDPGYTPENLVAVMTGYDVQVNQLAELLGVSLDTVSRWRAPIRAGSKYHVDMPYKQWLRLMAYCQEREAVS